MSDEIFSVLCINVMYFLLRRIDIIFIECREIVLKSVRLRLQIILFL